MTNDQPIEPMTEAEVTAFSTELEAWAATCSPKEQVFLRTVLVLATRAEPEDVQGYFAGSGIQAIGQLVTTMAAPLASLVPGAGLVVPGLPGPLDKAGTDSTAKQLNPINSKGAS